MIANIRIFQQMQLHCTVFVITFAAYENSYSHIHHLYDCPCACALR